MLIKVTHPEMFAKFVDRYSLNSAEVISEVLLDSNLYSKYFNYIFGSLNYDLF